MRLDRFRSYLDYMGCEMVGFTPSTYIYANSSDRTKIARFSKLDPIDKAAMYWVCTFLEIDMPPEHKEYQDTLDRIP